MASFSSFSGRLLLAVSLLSFAETLAMSAKIRIDPMTHDVSLVSQQNWDGKVLKFRDTQVFAVLFYKDDCAECKTLIDGEFNVLAKKMKGMVGVLAVNCGENAKLCRDQKVETFPSILIYPVLPLPPYKFEGKADSASLSRALGPLIPSSVMTPKDLKDFEKAMASFVQVPKVLIFSEKSKPSILLKALSTAFKDKLHLVLLSSEKFPELVKKYKVSKTPHMVVTRKDKKDEVYKGELTFQALFDWLNVFSETFVLGGGFSDHSPKAEASPETQPWKFQVIPELTKLSSADLCFKKSLKALCVIYLKEGRELTAEETDMLESLKLQFDSGKGPEFRFMWMDVATEKGFRALFDFEQYPSLVVFNPHLKTRFTKIDSEESLSKETIKALLDKIVAGNARFKVVPAAKMPAWENRKEEKKDEKKADKKDEL
ncbi:putative thioredoxin [Besnoitia besnoiti]|uniref:Putative thioredoxin n=1 Tax=Besnoitia besnoiti TaxID=94643 RepID=A0A2A9M7P1_BESBE|nr:putative thioredoxin [Besnoitia besnoiti]PFH31916.1 putative thioredoxin [Besnoitia besnoiti]